MTFFKRSGRQYALLGMSLMLLIPMVMALFAPLLAPIPSQSFGWSAPPLPERDEPLPDFQHLLEPLPIVVRDLPDAASQEVVAIYDVATFTDEQSAFRMLSQAEAAIQVPADLDRSWRSWLDNWQGEAVPPPVMAYLREDPENAGRLSNLAVARYFTWLTAVGTDSPLDYDDSEARQALTLLDGAVEYFPEHRPSILNYIFLQAASWAGQPNDNRSEDFDAWLASNPDDATALQLAVRLFVNSSIWDFEQDPETLRSHAIEMSESADPARAALGHALLGDLQIGDLRLGDAFVASKQEEAPFTVMHSARLALQHYDQALLLSEDPSIYTARALALELLGDIPAAVESQQRAVDLDPDSISLRLLLADLLLQRRGPVAEMRESIESARSHEREAVSIAQTQAMPSLSDVRFVRDLGEVAGFSSNRPEFFYLHYVPASGRGGGWIATFDLIPLYESSPVSSRSSMNPVDRASANAIVKSEALGDSAGVGEDIARRQTIIQDATVPLELPTVPELYASQAVASLVADHDDMSSEDLQPTNVLSAADWLRFVGANQKALDLCQTALSIVGAGDSYSPGLQACIAENAYLLGDHETSQDMFEALGDDLMVGYVAERRGDLDEAERRYRLVAGRGAGDESQIATLRLADVLLAAGDPSSAIAHYDEVIEWLSPAVEREEASVEVVALRHAHGNRGIARLQVFASDSGINCDGEAWEACTAAFIDFDIALGSDPYNPVYLMNQAWAARLLGDDQLSNQLMTRAREADTTLYPVLNDLGVFATESGDTEGARRYFLDAVAANPYYDLALWNLGVLHMREGVGGIVRGQAYLARAVARNPSLVTGSLDYLTDERVYRVEINEQMRPGAGWTFGAASSVATSIFGVVTVVLVIFQATYLIVRDKLLEILHGRVEAQSSWFRGLAAGKVPFRVDARWERWLVLAIPIVVLVGSTIWIARDGEPRAAAAMTALALFAVLLAVVVHESGHALAAWRLGATFQPAQWAPGAVLALVLLPLNVSSGPFPGQKVVARDQAVAKWVYIAGPLANLTVAVLAYLLFTLQPLPGLRLISQVQLAAMGYALLPFAPLDGAEIARTYPRLLALLGGIAALLGVLFSVGFL